MNSNRLSRQPSGGLLSRPTASRPCVPTWLESLLFLLLMSGPPKFRGRDLTASLAGELDVVALIQIAVWLCGGLWVIARLLPSLLRYGIMPAVGRAQVLAGTLIVALALSIWESPGVLLTAFVLGQFVVMVTFAWVFVYRFGARTFLRHLFFSVIALLLLIAGAVFVAPDLVLMGGVRLRGDYIAPTGALSTTALVLCLSNVLDLKAIVFWPAIAFFGVLLAASQTRTSYIALAVYIAVGYVYGKGLRVRQLVPLLAAACLALFLLDTLSSATGYMVRETESVQSISGRIPLWEYLVGAVMREAPLTGLGYYSASRVLASQHNPLLGNAHSVVFEVFVGGGFLATILYVGLCGSLLWDVGRLFRSTTHRAEAMALAGLLSVTLLQSLTGSDGMNPGPIGFTFWSLTAILPARQRELGRITSRGAQRILAPKGSARRLPTAVMARYKYAHPVDPQFLSIFRWRS
jgi:hypothetical protein